MSALDGLDVDVVDVPAIEDSALELEGVDSKEGCGGCFNNPVTRAKAEVLPFRWASDFTVGMAASDEDSRAKASSIDPNTLYA
ncbi:hypothetical protein BD769DRAFT_1680197 [Suillus cothurnatus]|nr:hypothetical protein BD769DRAFT_1680197 [Suillus cothurnatus]